VRAELLHADRQTDMTKLILAFRNFANAPNKKRQHEEWRTEENEKESQKQKHVSKNREKAGRKNGEKEG
jgi:hypothetical protein